MTIHSMTQCTPFSLMFAVNSDILQTARTTLANIQEARHQASNSAYSSRQQAIKKINGTRKAQVLSVGDLVFVVDLKANKLESRMEENQCRIVKLIGSKLVQLEDIYELKRVRNRKHVVLLTSLKD